MVSAAQRSIGRLTNSIDGERRMTLRVDARLTLEDLAALITSRIGMDADRYRDQSLTAYLIGAVSGKKHALMLAKEEVLASGIELPHYRVGDNKWNHVKDAVLIRLKDLWGTQ